MGCSPWSFPMPAAAVLALLIAAVGAAVTWWLVQRGPGRGGAGAAVRAGRVCAP
jgi:hypothetical protein